MPDFEVQLACFARLDGKVVVRGAGDQDEAVERALAHAKQARHWMGVRHTGAAVRDVQVTEVLPASGGYPRKAEID